MPIISFFGSGGGGGGGGLVLTAVTNIQTLAAAGKVYVKWQDPDDLVVAGSTLAAWGGTLQQNPERLSEHLLLRQWPNGRGNVLLQVLPLHDFQRLHGQRRR